MYKNKMAYQIPGKMNDYRVLPYTRNGIELKNYTAHNDNEEQTIWNTGARDDHINTEGLVLKEITENDKGPIIDIGVNQKIYK